MKKILLFVTFLSVSLFGGVPPGTNIGAVITPTDSADIFPTHNSLWGRGGFREVLNTTARNAIPPLRRVMGMLVYCTADSTTYQLRGDTTNASWQVYKLGKIPPDSSADAALWGGHSWPVDSVRASHKADTSVVSHFADSTKNSHKADTSIKSQRAVFADSATNSHKADTSIKTQRAVFADSSTNSHKADTAIKANYSIRADSSRASHVSDTALKLDNRYASSPLTAAEVSAGLVNNDSGVVTAGYLAKGVSAGKIGPSNLSESGTVLSCGDSIVSTKGATFGGPFGIGTTSPGSLLFGRCTRPESSSDYCNSDGNNWPQYNSDRSDRARGYQFGLLSTKLLRRQSHIQQLHYGGELSSAQSIRLGKRCGFVSGDWWPCWYRHDEPL